MPDVATALPADVRELLDAPNYVHLSTLRGDGSPRSWVLEGERVLICTTSFSWKAKDMQRDPRVAMSVIDRENRYRMASLDKARQTTLGFAHNPAKP